MVKNGCSYVFILDDFFQIVKSYIYLNPVKITPSNLKKLLFTNDYNLFNRYIRKNNPLSFKSFEQYYDFLQKKADQIKIINIQPYEMFSSLYLQSNSELINIQFIESWLKQNNRILKYLPLKTIKLYNFFNFVLYILSRNSLESDQKSMKLYFNDQIINQHLKIDITNNRCVNNNIVQSINYYSMSSSEPIRWKNLKPAQGKILYKIDYRASYLNLLAYVLQIKLDDEQDIYMYLGKQLQLGNIDRQTIKTRVFKILFSDQIKQYKHIQFFKKCYMFSIYLKEQYNKNGYLSALISQKQIRLSGSKISRSRLFNAFIMSLQTELYIGVLYNMLQFNKKDEIKPVIFIYDAIILQTDVEWCINNMKQIQQIFTFNGILKISHSIGSDLSKFQKI